jgi:hypothetical protein
MSTNFERLRSISIDELVGWLDANGHSDAAWWKWFEENYCNKCESETVYIDDIDGENTWKTKCECAYCEVHDECRFFPKMKLFDSQETIKMWLEVEVEE